MKAFLIISAMFALSALTASAGTVTYSTSASQLCVGASGCGVGTQTIGGSLSVTYNPIPSSTVLADPTTFSSFGQIVIACIGGGSACSSQSLAGLNLYLNITQTVPSNGNASITGGVIAGSISGSGSSATITWAVPNAVNIGTVSYSLFNNQLSLVPPSAGGTTSIQGVITDSPVPEPSTYALISSALLGIGLLRKRLARQ